MEPTKSPETEQPKQEEQKQEDRLTSEGVREIFENVLNERGLVRREELAAYATHKDVERLLSDRITPLNKSVSDMADTIRSLAESQVAIKSLAAKLDTFIAVRTSEIQQLQAGHEKQLEQIKANGLAIDSNTVALKSVKDTLYKDATGLVPLFQKFSQMEPKFTEIYNWHMVLKNHSQRFGSFLRTRTGGSFAVIAAITGIKVIQTLDIDAIGQAIIALLRVIFIGS